MKLDPGDIPCGTVAITVRPLLSGAETWIVWPPETPGGTVTASINIAGMNDQDVENHVELHPQNTQHSNLTRNKIPSIYR